MISPQGYQLGKKPTSKNPFWGQGETESVERIFASATVDDNVGTPQVQTSKTISGNDITFGFNFKNLKGRPGTDGRNGSDGRDGMDGRDGYSPTANVEQIPNGARINITDKNGSTSAIVKDGKDGKDGQDGYSPSANVTQTASGAIVTVTDANGQTTANIENGAPGQNGYSPTATVTPNASGAELVVTDANGQTRAQIENGTDGSDGISPSVSVTDIPGGHRITITDASGDHSFDVMDADTTGIEYRETWNEHAKALELTGGGSTLQSIELTGVAMEEDIDTRTFGIYDIAELGEAVQSANADLNLTSGKITKVKLNESTCLVFYAADYSTTRQVSFNYHEVVQLVEKFRPTRIEAIQGWIGLSQAVCNLMIGSSGKISVKFAKSETIPSGTAFYVTGMWITTNMTF